MTNSERKYPASEPGVIDMGQRHYMRFGGDDGRVYWWHDCPKVKHVSWGWIGGKSGERQSGHLLRHSGDEFAPTLTVEGSLVCTDCGDHGFIRDSRWVPA